MNFQDLPPVPSATSIVNDALKAAGEKAAAASRKTRKTDSLVRQQGVQKEHLRGLIAVIDRRVDNITSSFPSFDSLPEFYTRLASVTLDAEALKKSLGRVAGNAAAAKRLANEYGKRYSACNSFPELLALKRQALGRIISMLKRSAKDFEQLEKARKVLRTYPALQADLFTVAIAGFPNVGKSTLLRKLTSAKPEVNSYAFTTKTLNVGSFTYRHNKIQVIDTPGTLDRLEKMNPVERQAELAMRYAAHVIVYVYDLTEEYPLRDQELLERHVREHGKSVIVYASKSDVLDGAVLAAFRTRHDICISSEEVRERLCALFDDEFLGRKSSR